MYLIEESDAVERNAGEGMDGGSTTLGRPIIVGVDRNTGTPHAHQVKCERNGDFLVVTGIAAVQSKFSKRFKKLQLQLHQDKWQPSDQVKWC